ncbi:MAG: hypothetical protein ACK4JX_10180 [Flavobacterium sp.]|jgi:hypothetical protein|nr:hypothetical protein [Flavobacteriales bacterium]
MERPKFVLADNSDFPDDLFVIHLDYPRFLINLKDDEVEFLEEIDQEDEEEVAQMMDQLIDEAGAFYDREMERLDEEE